jgi:hypothetical protein
LKLGLKAALWKQKNILPQTSLIINFEFPGIASKSFKAQHIAPAFLLAMQNEVTPQFGLSYNIGYEWDGFSTSPALLYSLSSGFELGKRWEAFLEAFGFSQKNSVSQMYTDAGLGFYLNNNAKLDGYLGFGVSEQSINSFFGIGFSIRFNTRRIK